MNWEYNLGTSNPQSHHICFDGEMTETECWDALEKSGMDLDSVEFVEFDQAVGLHFGFSNAATFHELD